MSTPWPSAPPRQTPPRAGTPRWAIALIALVTALVMVVGVFVVLTLTGGSASAGEVTREPVNTAGANPFMPSVGTDSPQVKPVANTGGTYRGDTPGLYGGTRDNRTCDAAKLTGFLNSHPGQAAAWAGVLGIRTNQIDSYVSGLTPVLLRSDTRVTNHGYSGGSATVISSVLQAGTAVFVDRYGSPVVRCACGNPLTSPTLLTSPVYVGPTWVSFTQTNVTVVQNTTNVINNYTIVDPYKNRPFDRPTGYKPGPGYQAPDDGDYGQSPLPEPGRLGGTTLLAPPGSSTGSAPGTPFDAQTVTCPDSTAPASRDGQSSADLTGDGRDETAVAITCGGQQQVLVYRPDGTQLASLPSPMPPPGGTVPPEFDAAREFTLTPQSLSVAMTVSGPDGGPADPQTWRWDWDGSSFTLAEDTVIPLSTSSTPTPETSTTLPADPTTTETTTTGDTTVAGN